MFVTEISSAVDPGGSVADSPLTGTDGVGSAEVSLSGLEGVTGTEVVGSDVGAGVGVTIGVGVGTVGVIPGVWVDILGVVGRGAPGVGVASVATAGVGVAAGTKQGRAGCGT